jgi:hypothetical protein
MSSVLSTSTVLAQFPRISLTSARWGPIIEGPNDFDIPDTYATTGYGLQPSPCWKYNLRPCSIHLNSTLQIQPCHMLLYFILSCFLVSALPPTWTSWLQYQLLTDSKINSLYKYLAISPIYSVCSLLANHPINITHTPSPQSSCKPGSYNLVQSGWQVVQMMSACCSPSWLLFGEYP